MRFRRYCLCLVFGSPWFSACGGSSPPMDNAVDDGTGGVVASASGGQGGAVAPVGGASTAAGGRGSGGAVSTGGLVGVGGSATTGGTASSVGGANAGGLTTGGTGTGGAGTGGKAAGGAIAGGVSSGGIGTGGKAAAGAGTGGNSPGGKATGGAGTGGSATGGVGIGGKATGGAAGSTVVPGTKVTVYLAGDSTVQTYATNANDQQGWGQRLQEFFQTNVVIVNKAIGGRSSKSYIDEGRLTEILNVIKAGDYLFAQWGINDRYTSDPARYTNPATTFRDYLKQYINGARGKNAIPILVTPTPRHQYVNGVFENGFPEYCTAIKAVGSETNTPVIDLQAKGLAYYTSVGETVVASTLILDALHFKSPGAYQMARLVAEGAKELNLPTLSPYVK